MAHAQAQAAPTSPLKSSLSFNSGRVSPFRRPDSPSQARAPTPTQAYQNTRPVTPSKLANSSTPSFEPQQQYQQQQPLVARPRDAPISPTRLSQSILNDEQHGSPFVAPLNVVSQHSTPRALPSPSPASRGTVVNMDMLSRLPPAQVREMREAFQILDQDSDGMVNREDVAEMLRSLGLDTSSGSIAPYFPASLPHPVPLPVYLSQLSSLLAPLSPPQELLAALAAFDDDDSGQVDIAELVQAVTSSRPEDGSRALSQKDVETVMEGFTGRRAFSAFGQPSNKARGDVFRYRDWVSGLGAVGSSSNNNNNNQAKTATA